MKLGKLQKYWVEQLRKHPERQMDSKLGEGTPRDYKACCLGELLLCDYRLNKKKLPFNIENNIEEAENSVFYLYRTYDKFGLFSHDGKLSEGVSINDKFYSSLERMNDGGLTWIEIADFIEANPEKVFTKSV